MRGLSLHQPWLDFILRGQKDIETRSWKTAYRGKILLCSSKTFDREVKRVCNMHQMEKNLERGYKPLLGHAMGTADLVDCIPMTEEHKERAMFFRWWDIENKFSWVLENVQILEDPFPIKGRQRLFKISEEILNDVEARTK